MIRTRAGNYVNPRYIVKVIWHEGVEGWVATLTDRSETILDEGVVQTLAGKQWQERPKDAA